MSGSEVAGEVRAYLRRTVEALCEVRDVAVGWAASCAELELVPTLNQLHVTTPCTPNDALTAAEDHQAGLDYRRLVVDPPELAAALTARLVNWETNREVLMVLTRSPSRPVDTTGVVQLDEDETASLARSWALEEHPKLPPRAIDQLVEYTRREGRVWHERRFGIRQPDGTPAAMTKLRTDPSGTAWVEDVYTLPDRRRRGHARTLVTHAVDTTRSEGHPLTFILADDNDWPKHLYSDIGFRPIAHQWTFHRHATSSQP